VAYFGQYCTIQTAKTLMNEQYKKQRIKRFNIKMGKKLGFYWHQQVTRTTVHAGKDIG
jgi:hypothetical protein